MNSTTTDQQQHEQQQQSLSLDAIPVKTLSPQSTHALKHFIQQLTHKFQVAHQHSDPAQRTVNEHDIRQLFHQYMTSDTTSPSSPSSSDNDNNSDTTTTTPHFQLKDIMNYCFYDAESSYTRNLIYENDQFSLMMLVWHGNSTSCIHAHGGSQCWFRVLHGCVNEVFYQVNCMDDVMKSDDSGSDGSSNNNNSNNNNQQQPPVMTWSKNQTLNEHSVPIRIQSAHVNDVCYIDDTRGMHRIENANHGDLSVTIHCYAPPYERCKIYDRTGRPIVGRVSFDTEYGEVKTESKTIGLVPYEQLVVE